METKKQKTNIEIKDEELCSSVTTWQFLNEFDKGDITSKQFNDHLNSSTTRFMEALVREVQARLIQYPSGTDNLVKVVNECVNNINFRKALTVQEFTEFELRYSFFGSIAHLMKTGIYAKRNEISDSLMANTLKVFLECPETKDKAEIWIYNMINNVDESIKHRPIFREAVACVLRAVLQLHESITDDTIVICTRGFRLAFDWSESMDQVVPFAIKLIEISSKNLEINPMFDSKAHLALEDYFCDTLINLCAMAMKCGPANLKFVDPCLAIQMDTAERQQRYVEMIYACVKEGHPLYDSHQDLVVDVFSNCLIEDPKALNMLARLAPKTWFGGEYTAQSTVSTVRWWMNKAVEILDTATCFPKIGGFISFVLNEHKNIFRFNRYDIARMFNAMYRCIARVGGRVPMWYFGSSVSSVDLITAMVEVDNALDTETANRLQNFMTMGKMDTPLECLNTVLSAQKKFYELLTEYRVEYDFVTGRVMSEPVKMPASGTVDRSTLGCPNTDDDFENPIDGTTFPMNDLEPDVYPPNTTFWENFKNYVQELIE